MSPSSIWLVCVPINILTILFLTWQTRKHLGFVSWSGAAWLTFWSCLLGPVFTAITVTYLLVEYYD